MTLSEKNRKYTAICHLYLSNAQMEEVALVLDDPRGIGQDRIERIAWAIFSHPRYKWDSITKKVFARIKRDKDGLIAFYQEKNTQMQKDFLAVQE